MKLLKELLSLHEGKTKCGECKCKLVDGVCPICTNEEKLDEVKNHLGEIVYTSFSSWKRACRKADSGVWFDGDMDICNAFVGRRPYVRGETRAIGEWDGEQGSLFVEPKAKDQKDD